MDILLVAGHGQGDAGTCANGYKECDLTRDLCDIIYPYLSMASHVDYYPKELDMYQQCYNGHQPDFWKYDYVFEVHFNSYDTMAYGVEALLHPDESGCTVEETILSYIENVGFYNRGIKRRDDLLNMRLCEYWGVSYCLLEVCFMDNQKDLSLYFEKKYEVANAIVRGIVDGFGLEG